MCKLRIYFRWTNDCWIHALSHDVLIVTVTISNKKKAEVSHKNTLTTLVPSIVIVDVLHHYLMFEYEQLKVPHVRVSAIFTH